MVDNIVVLEEISTRYSCLDGEFLLNQEKEPCLDRPSRSDIGYRCKLSKAYYIYESNSYKSKLRQQVDENHGRRSGSNRKVIDSACSQPLHLRTALHLSPNPSKCECSSDIRYRMARASSKRMTYLEIIGSRCGTNLLLIAVRLPCN